MSSTKTTQKHDPSTGDWAETAKGVEIYDRTTEAIMPSIGAILESFNEAFQQNTELLARTKGALGRKRKCLDIGCGPGSFTLKYLLPRLPAWCEGLVAVDNAEPMLEFARKNRGDPKIEYKTLDLMADEDVAQFVAEQGQFDMVFSFLTLHWISDQHHAFRNVEKLMAAGGECFIVFSHTLVLFDIYAALIESPRWKKYSDVLKSYIPATHNMDIVALRSHAASLVRGANLVLLSGEVFRTSAAMQLSVEEAAGFYTRSNPVHRLLPEEEKAELCKFTWDFLDSLSKQDFGRRLKEQQMLVIHAYKAEK